ncbi:hypothetical protein [Flavobacterium aquicola]|uniref:Uncharacterized protein n=1 Tax=Flavobacterium aquicola TaxID=1682742 RepID=A0A3E0EPR4_9FLAO|nr:hypothetical protein [Flavobacterium aquicola]REG99146.1 hypothetical protein C8P67_105318 [Flavobacterium aquicola]
MKIIKYLFAILFVLSGSGGLIKGSIIAGALLIILGILILPPISVELSQKIKFWNYRGFRYGMYTIFFLLIGATMKELPKRKKENPTEVSKISFSTAPKSEVKSKVKLVNFQKEEIQIDNSDFWNKFDPIVKERVYKMIKEKDCAGLQEEFNVTADNLDRLQASGRSGERNLDLMNFLEEQMKNLGCH